MDMNGMSVRSQLWGIATKCSQELILLINLSTEIGMKIYDQPFHISLKWNELILWINSLEMILIYHQ